MGSTTEITLAVRRVVIMRRIRRCGSLFEGWCELCGKEVRMIYVGRAEQSSPSPEAISRKIIAGCFHFTAAADGQSFVCLDSLLE